MGQPLAVRHGLTPTHTGTGRSSPEDQRRGRLAVNITPPERFGRIVVGALGVIGGTVLLVSAGSALAVVLEVLLIVAGLDLVVTGALGHCPLYQKLGFVPASLRRPS